MVPLGTEAIVPRKAESDWRRTRSKAKPLLLLMLKVVWVFVELVSVMEVGTTRKLTSPSVDGGLLETSTKLTFVLPPWLLLPPPWCWQEQEARLASNARERKDLLDFMDTPPWGAYSPRELVQSEIRPADNLAREGWPGSGKNVGRCLSAKESYRQPRTNEWTERVCYRCGFVG